MKRNLEQLRAENALSRVSKLEDKPDEFKKLYRSYVDRLGPTIVMNGLGQALATELAAAGSNPKDPRERAHRKLFDNLQQWLCREPGGVYPENPDLLQAITQHDESRYVHAQTEALAWLEWHRKCCRAMLPRGEGE